MMASVLPNIRDVMVVQTAQTAVMRSDVVLEMVHVSALELTDQQNLEKIVVLCIHLRRHIIQA